MSNKEDELLEFIRLVAFKHVELSQDKVLLEYLFFKKRARELYNEYFHEDIHQQPTVNDEF